MSKLSVVYNICGISGKENPAHWAAVLESIFAQDFDDFNVVVGACMVDEAKLLALADRFPKALFVGIQEVVPINVSFNFAVQKSIEDRGVSEGYLYLDYGVIFSAPDQLRKLYELFKSGPYSMVSSRTDTDNGYHLWFGLGRFHGDESENDRLFEGGDFIVPVGKCVNLHAQIFSHELYEAYGGRLMPDIFAAYCTESVFSFQNAAIKKQWVISKDVILHHECIAMNGASGFGCGVNGLDRMFRDPTPVLDRITPGIPYGMGYDESRGLVMHDTTQFDEYGFCKNEKLKEYIKDHLFLSDRFLKYEDIQHICLN